MIGCSNETEGGDEMVVPWQTERNVVNHVAQYLTENHEIYCNQVTEDGSNLSSVHKDTCEESPRYLSHSPAIEDDKLDVDGGPDKHSDFEDVAAEEDEKDHDQRVVEVEEDVVDDPVVVHFHSIDLHNLDQTLFLLSHDSHQEEGVAHHKANWYNAYTHDLNDP
jgi:hypothetical protein